MKQNPMISVQVTKNIIVKESFNVKKFKFDQKYVLWCNNLCCNKQWFFGDDNDMNLLKAFKNGPFVLLKLHFQANL